jgi:hypothetical protein
MAFLAPLALLGLLLVSLPLLIHLLVRRRGERLDFPSLRFLRETPSFRLHPRHIRQPLLLALRAAAIVLIAVGLAQPLFTFRAQTPETAHFILIDASLSMKGRGRAEAAREQARTLLNQLKSGERASVIALSSDPTVLVELTAEREKLLEAINQYQPTSGSVDYRAGLESVRAQLQTEPQIVAQADIISDFQESGLEDQAAAFSRADASLRIVAYPVGSEIERNAFLMDEAVRKTASGLELSASEIVAETNGRSGTRRTWMIDAGGGTRPGIEWRTEANNQITGRLETLEPDEFDTDDQRFFAFAPPRESRVLLIEDEGGALPYLRAALEAGAGQEKAASFALERRARLPESAADLASFSMVVVTLSGPAQEEAMRVLLEYARTGATVWLFLGRDLDTSSWNALAGANAVRELPFESITRRSGNRQLTFGTMDTTAPQLRELDESALAALGAVRVSESYLVAPRAFADTLMRWNDHTPAFISARVGAGTILLLATSAERASSELGLSPAFPALASSIMRASRFEHESLSQTIGEAVRLNVAPQTAVKITSANGQVDVTRAGELVRRPLRFFNEPGIYRLEFAGEQKFLAFNAPVLESERALAAGDRLKQNLPTSETETVRAINTNSLRGAMERSGSTWRLFLCAAFLLMIAELFVAIRERRTSETLSE